MQVTTRSAAATARRSQILEATIDVVAEEGFAKASFARICERAGLSSTRLISYHFAGKAELVSALVEHVGALVVAA
jgi:AcrR family transcriptional regulator